MSPSTMVSPRPHRLFLLVKHRLSYHPIVSIQVLVERNSDECFDGCLDEVSLTLAVEAY